MNIQYYISSISQQCDQVSYNMVTVCVSLTVASSDDNFRLRQTSQHHRSLRGGADAAGAVGLLPLTCGRPVLPPSGARIVGGDESRPRSWPWQIALRNRNARSSRCAGSLIAAQWVLTTAHCVDQLVLHFSSLFLSHIYSRKPLCPSSVSFAQHNRITHRSCHLGL